MNIYHNAAVTNLGGLGGITSVGIYLAICGNTNLTNLDGLSALTMLGFEFWIYDNDILPDCEVCDLLDQLTSGPTSISVHNNMDDTCTPVPSNCP